MTAKERTKSLAIAPTASRKQLRVRSCSFACHLPIRTRQTRSCDHDADDTPDRAAGAERRRSHEHSRDDPCASRACPCGTAGGRATGIPQEPASAGRSGTLERVLDSIRITRISLSHT
jgi:hypothetical protein